MLEITNALTKYKEENNLSWYRVAKDLDVPYQTIDNWKKGKFNPSLVYQKHILEYVNKKR